jgi:hypothetical protein
VITKLIPHPQVRVFVFIFTSSHLQIPIKRRERAVNEQNQSLERSLTKGGTVQQKYDGHFSRLGQ